MILNSLIILIILIIRYIHFHCLDLDILDHHLVHHDSLVSINYLDNLDYIDYIDNLDYLYLLSHI